MLDSPQVFFCLKILLRFVQQLKVLVELPPISDMPVEIYGENQTKFVRVLPLKLFSWGDLDNSV